MTRREELDEIFKDVDENKKKLIKPLLDDIAFLEISKCHLLEYTLRILQSKK